MYIDGPLYRLCPAKYPTNSGDGAAKYGGRWNPPGVPVIYCSTSASLATLEILVNNEALPKDYALAEIRIPRRMVVEHVHDTDLPPNWDAPTYYPNVQSFGAQWVKEMRSAVLSVPSSILGVQINERNCIINPMHPEFKAIRFHPAKPFQFDPRLK